MAVSIPADALASAPPAEEEEERSVALPAAILDDVCGRYRLCFALASGGMAGVYLARQEGYAGFTKLVALKRVHQHLENEGQFLEMFLDESRIASRITHPNVCAVTDFGRAHGRYYLAMEYLFGESLARVRKRLFEDRPAFDGSLRYVLRIIADAAEGLHAAHELRDDNGHLLNVIHRDVAPQNLFVGYDGNTKVVDFGIAKARGRLTNTATGVLKGHIAYMAPEQFTTTLIDRRADVWALGVVLWELLTGRRLFQHASSKTEASDVTSTVRAVLSSTPITRVTETRRDVPAELDAIVGRCLDRSPAGRYETARALGKDLNRLLHRHCEPTSIADVSEWMESLFPIERTAKTLLMREAHQLGS